MPIFEYVCRECENQFELLVQGTTKIECPSCQSDALDKQLSVFAAATKSGDSNQAIPMGSCGSCGYPRGPGACSMN